MRIPALLASLLLLAPALSAARFEFLAFSNEQRVPGARVCFSKARQHEHLIPRSIVSAETRCFAADDVLDVPPGSWHFSVISPDDRLVSSHPFRIDVAEGDASAFLNNVKVDLLPAATIEFARAAGAQFHAVYVSNDGQVRSPAAIRIADGNSRVVVPAGMAVVPLLMENGRIVAIGNDVVLRERETVRLEDIRRPGKGRRDVVAHVTLADKRLTAGNTPAIRITTRDGQVLAEAPLRAVPQFHDSLVFFRDVPASDVVAELHGTGWRTASQPLASGNGITISEPLVAAQSATLSLEWSIDPELAADQPSGCDRKTEAASPFAVVRLHRCTPDEAARFERRGHAQCEVAFSRELRNAQSSGSEIVAALPAGEYIAELRRGTFRTIQRLSWSGRSDVAQQIHLAAGSVTGRVTREGAPVQAHLEFPNGRAVSDASTGMYRMLIAETIPRRTLASVTPCDGSSAYLHRSHGEVAPGSTHDIDIPSAGITVDVTNAATGDGIENAHVRISDDAEFPLYEVEAPATDEHGRTSVAPVLHDEALFVCAGAENFVRRCADLVRVEGKTVEVKLRLAPRKPGIGGKVVSSRPLRGGQLWLVQNGEVLARAIVRTDQRFTFDRLPPGGTLILTDATHGLAVVGAPSFDSDGVMVVNVPELPPTAFTILVQEGFRSSSSIYTLRFGNLLLPRTVFIAHQHRGTSLVPGIPVTVTNILTTAPIFVVLGLPIESIPAGVTDIFSRPELVPAMPVKRVVAGTVTFN